jgi:hypothetical protein
MIQNKKKNKKPKKETWPKDIKNPAAALTTQTIATMFQYWDFNHMSTVRDFQKQINDLH